MCEKFRLAFLAAALLVSFSGCSGAGSGEDDAAEADVSTSDSVEVVPPE